MISGIRHVHMRLSCDQYANKNQSFWELTQFESHCYGVLVCEYELSIKE